MLNPSFKIHVSVHFEPYKRYKAEVTEVKSPP
jgi:hypothetical protein